MPTNVVKTPADERLWQKAKARAKEQGKADNYAYIMGIYKQMNPRMASAQRVAARFRDEDYVDLLQKKISLKEFLKKHPKIKAVDTQRLDALPESGLSRGYDYDCFVHAELRAVQLSEAKSYREVDWEPIGLDGAGANPPRGAEIPWSEAKKGDWVRWPGLGGHHGVVIDPNRKIVESCWGYKGTVFQHPVDYHPYGGGGEVFPVRPKVSAQRVAARYAAQLPLMDPLYNLREAAKELLLLEDHLGHAQKHCPDCIRKHLLTTEALLEEAVRLDTEGEMLGLLSPLPAQVRELWTAYQDGRPEHEIGQAARVLRKGLVEASADVRVARHRGRTR